MRDETSGQWGSAEYFFLFSLYYLSFWISYDCHNFKPFHGHLSFNYTNFILLNSTNWKTGIDFYRSVDLEINAQLQFLTFDVLFRYSSIKVCKCERRVLKHFVPQYYINYLLCYYFSAIISCEIVKNEFKFASEVHNCLDLFSTPVRILRLKMQWQRSIPNGNMKN